jgi:uncharacterized cupredoxin-like copper-binding protein
MRRALTTLVFATLLLSIASPFGGRAKEGQIDVGQVVYVTEDGVSIQDTPSTGGIVIDTLYKGDPVRIVDAQPVEADGIEWWNVSDDHVGIEGWIAGDWISADLFAIATNTPIQASWMLTPTVAPPMSTSMETTLAARDLIFEPAELYLAESGKPTVIHFTNKGALTHHFHIDELGIEAEAQPGATVDIEIQGGTPAGIYTFYCSVPGHKEAGMFGTLVIYPGNATPITTVRDVVDPSGCAGFQGYIDRYDAATANAIAANPEAVALFGGSPDTGHTLSPFDLTPEQLMLVSEYFSDMGSALAQIDPPEFARPWHLLDIEMAETFAKFFQFAAAYDPLAAVLQYGAKLDELTAEAAQVLAAQNTCPAFVAWANT